VKNDIFTLLRPDDFLEYVDAQVDVRAAVAKAEVSDPRVLEPLDLTDQIFGVVATM